MLTGISINKSELEINIEARQIKRLKLVRVSQDVNMGHISEEIHNQLVKP